MSRSRTQRVLWLLMVIVIAMTATPIVILANRITPSPLGVPFFLLWCGAVPLLLWVLMILHSRVASLEGESES